MPHLLYLVTNNNLKFHNAQAALQEYGVALEQVKMDVPELQSQRVKEIAEYSARCAGERLKAAVIKIDVAFEIRALNGFPGPYIKYINQWLPPEKILRLMRAETDRRAQFVDAVALYDPTIGCVSFSAATTGSISKRAKGKNGWGMDQIFVPDGFSEPLATLSDDQKKGVWNHAHWDQLGAYLQRR